MTVDQLDLFTVDDVVAIQPKPVIPPLVLAYPNNLLPWQEEAAANGDGLLLLELAEAWRAERYGHWPQVRRDIGEPYAWTLPGWGRARPVDPPAECRGAGVLASVDLRCNCRVPSWRGSALPPRDGQCRCPGDLIYRHVCVSCGHVSPARADENGAAEDTLDHEWPGWADLPLAPKWEQDGSGKDADVEKWLARCEAAGYTRDHLTAGGPIRTARTRYGTRHVPDRTPFRGYDVGVLVEEPAP